MNRTELVKRIAHKANVTNGVADAVLKATLESIQEELAGGGSVAFVGFGTFEVHTRAERTVRNPRNGVRTLMPARKLPRFRPGQTLKEAVI